MWRFVFPTLMAAVIASSTYFMFTNKPVYTAWNRNMVRFSFFMVCLTYPCSRLLEKRKSMQVGLLV